MAKSVASADRSKTRQASSNVKSTSQSFVIHRTSNEPIRGMVWHAQCCKSDVPYPFSYIQLLDDTLEYPWLCMDCARKHGLIW